LIIDAERVLKGEIIIYGFYSLAIKTLELSEGLSKNTIKRIDGFSKDVMVTEAILLGQLGKNLKYSECIAGQSILEDALDTVYTVHGLAGGRIVFLECDEKQKLIEFYAKCGFIPLQKKWRLSAND
jgi:hypothetical protein